VSAVAEGGDWGRSEEETVGREGQEVSLQKIIHSVPLEQDKNSKLVFPYQ